MRATRATSESFYITVFSQNRVSENKVNKTICNRLYFSFYFTLKEYNFIKVLWEGLVTKEDKDEKTTSIHNLNQKIHKDERVDTSFLPLADGLNLARKI